MMSIKSEEEQPKYLTREDIRWMERRMENMQRQIRLIIRIMVDKKLIGEEIAKSFMETADKEAVLRWFLDREENKK